MFPFFFRLDNKGDLQKYGDLISDFAYFKDSESFEKKIDNDPVRIREYFFEA